MMPAPNDLPFTAASRARAQRLMDYLINRSGDRPRMIKASPEARVEALKAAQGGGGVLWVSNGPGQRDWEAMETSRQIAKVVTREELVAARLLGYSPHWNRSYNETEISHVSGGRVLFWCRIMPDDGQALRGFTFELVVDGGGVERW